MEQAEPEVLPPGPLRRPADEPVPEWIQLLPEVEFDGFCTFRATREIAEAGWRWDRWFEACLLWGPDAAGPQPTL